MGLAGRDERVHRGCTDRGVVIAAKQVVLPPEGQRSDGILDEFVVDEPVSVVDCIVSLARHL